VHAATLSLASGEFGRLIAKTRDMPAREAEVDIDPGADAADDKMVHALQDARGDLSLEEVS
jgi:hypothetical protein